VATAASSEDAAAGDGRWWLPRSVYSATRPADRRQRVAGEVSHSASDGAAQASTAAAAPAPAAPDLPHSHHAQAAPTAAVGSKRRLSAEAAPTAACPASAAPAAKRFRIEGPEEAGEAEWSQAAEPSENSAVGAAAAGSAAGKAGAGGSAESAGSSASKLGPCARPFLMRVRGWAAANAASSSSAGTACGAPVQGSEAAAAGLRSLRALTPFKAYGAALHPADATHCAEAWALACAAGGAGGAVAYARVGSDASQGGSVERAELLARIDAALAAPFTPLVAADDHGLAVAFRRVAAPLVAPLANEEARRSPGSSQLRRAAAPQAVCVAAYRGTVTAAGGTANSSAPQSAGAGGVAGRPLEAAAAEACFTFEVQVWAPPPLRAAATSTRVAAAAPSDGTPDCTDGFLVVPLLLALNDAGSCEAAGTLPCSSSSTAADAAPNAMLAPSAALTNRGRFERWADRLRADVERTSRRWRRRRG